MNKKEIYTNYLEKLETSLVSDDLEGLDYLLETLYTSNIPEKDFLEIEEILQEATLYLEYKEETYREMALELISNMKN